VCNPSGAEALSRGDFVLAVRAVGAAQASGAVPPRDALLSGAVAPAAAHFEGHAGPSYAVSAADQAKYDSIFATTDGDGDGFVSGAEAVALFSKSGLDKATLKAIWTLADADRDARLDHGEFSVAMHLVVSVSKRGLPLPPALPTELLGGAIDLAAARSVAANAHAEVAEALAATVAAVP
jgi:hypothetical protein